jgi:signal transduction histidine kinase
MTSEAELIARAVVAQHAGPQILAASAEIARRILAVDSAFVAVATDAASYPMLITDGIRDYRFREITVRPGTGLGGQVLLRGRPHRVADYLNDPTISRDFVHVVCEVEGLRGMACMPISGPDRTEALLYFGTRSADLPPDRAMQTLELVAVQAELSLRQAAARKQELELAMLRDRQRMATQLHDSVAQMLFAIGVAAHHARQQADPGALTAALEEIETTAAQARSELRASLYRLSQPIEGLAFEARMAGEARLFERTTGCHVTITAQGERRDMPQPIEDLVIDAALEGMRNAFKYGRARVAELHLAYAHHAVTLVLKAGQQIIRADRAADQSGSGTGAGLALLRQRAAQLRGTMELTCDVAGYTVLRLELPTSPMWERSA